MKIYILLTVLSCGLCAQGPLTTVPADSVVATVDGKDLTAGDIRTMLETSPPSFAQTFQKDPFQTIEAFFVIRYLAEQGEKLKLAEESPLKEELEILRMNAVAGAFFNHERNAYPVTGDEITAYYTSNQARYRRAQIKAIQISFKTTVTSDTPSESVADAAQKAFQDAHVLSQRSEEQAKALATTVVKQLRDGADFGFLVQKYSEDLKSKALAGDFGVVTPTSVYPEELKKVVFALRPGEISDPVREPNAFYILRVETIAVDPINDVRESIIQDIRQAYVGDLLSSLHQRFRPKVQNPVFFTQPSPVTPSTIPLLPH